MDYCAQVEEIWEAVYNPTADTETVIETYFHPDYEQCINGVSLNRTDYIKHVVEQKKNMTVEQIDYKHMIEKEGELFALHYPKGKNQAGDPIEAEVVSYFYFIGPQIRTIHGQVRLLQGSLSDVDMD